MNGTNEHADTTKETGMTAPPTPNSVSRYLGQRFTRSFTSRAAAYRGLPAVSSGYEVRLSDGTPRVEYTVGTGQTFMDAGSRRQEIAREIRAMEKHLLQRYAVVMFEPAEGEGFYLTVLSKRGS